MSPSRPARRRATLLLGGLVVLALAAGVSLVGLGDQPFYTKGEPREAMVVWEMAHGGGIVLPLRNGTEIPSKPPFFHWLALLVARATGEVSELSARLPSALLSIAAVLAVYGFGATTGRIRSGWLAATSLLLSFEWLRAARIARVDMTLAVFIAGALLCFAVMDRTGVTRLRLAVFYSCLAAAMLGKGPVGVALPALVILVYSAVRPVGEVPFAPAGASPEEGGAPGASSGTRPRDGAIAGTGARWRGRLGQVVATVRRLEPTAGLAAVLAVTGAWYGAAFWVGGDDFLVKQVLKENVLRMIDPEGGDTGHAHGPLYLVSSFFLGALPWSPVVPAIAWWLWRMRPLDRTDRYLVVWFLTVVGFFLIPSSKRSVYLLPAYPAGALLLGRVLGPGPEGPGPRRLAAWGLTAGASAVAALGAASLVLASGLPLADWLSPLLAPHDRAAVGAVLAAVGAQRWLALSAALLAIGGALTAIREAPGAHWLRAGTALTVATVALYAGVVAPAERGVALSRTLAPFMAEVRRRAGDERLAFLCAFDYGAVFYAQRHFTPAAGPDRCPPAAGGRPRCRDHVIALLDDDECRDTARRLAAVRDPSAPRWILVWESDVAPIAPEVEVVLRSEGTGPKGRSRMLLVTPRARPGGGSPT